ncbi:MAG: LacI family DNA-binding transcriptional regulator [Opitutales bacterium]
MPASRRISLQDIAAEANVSKSTVSLALRDHPRIPSSTRNRIRRIADALGYQPDPAYARLMAAMKQQPRAAEGVLAFVRSGPTDAWEPMEALFHRELTRAARGYGYRLEPFRLFQPGTRPEAVNAAIWNRGIDGVIIPMIHPEHYNQGLRTLPVEWEKFCVVEIADTIQTPRLNGIRHNHFGGMLRTLSELEALGYGRIGLCVEAGVELRTHHRWTAGYLLWKSMRGLSDQLPIYSPGEYQTRALADWVVRNRIDAVISPGVEVCSMLCSEGLAVPGEVAFASLHRWGEGAEAVTGIDQNTRAQANIAIDMLVGLIHRGARGIPDNPILATDPGRWLAGTTTRPPPPNHRIEPLDNEPLGFPDPRPGTAG